MMTLNKEGQNVLVISRAYSSSNSSGATKDFVSVLSGIAGVRVQVLVRNLGGWKDERVTTFVGTIRRMFDRFFFECRRGLIRLARGNHLLIKYFDPVRNTDKKFALQVYDESRQVYSTSYMLKKLRIKPDAVFVMVTHKTVNFKNLFEIHKMTGAPIFLWLWDMNHMTGGCHYAWDCKGFERMCGNCPAYYSNKEEDCSRKNWLFKKRFADQMDLRLVYSSPWTDFNVKRSSLLRNKPSYKIPLPINDKIFSPGDQVRSRRRFEIEDDRKVIFFGSVSLDNPRKGFDKLLQALDILSELVNESLRSKVEIIVAGKVPTDFSEKLQFPCKMAGLLDFNGLSEAYRAADLFVSPTIQDAGPMMVNQSLLCGTPVVAFNMGCALDLVVDGETGYRVPCGDVKGMAESILKILNMSLEARRTMSYRCREIGMKTNSIPAITEKVKTLLASVPID